MKATSRVNMLLIDVWGRLLSADYLLLSRAGVFGFLV